MEITKRNGSIDENTGYSSTAGPNSLTDVVQTETSNEKYKFYEEYSVQNSLNENENNYMNSVFNYYEHNPDQKSSYHYSKLNHEISNVIDDTDLTLTMMFVSFIMSSMIQIMMMLDCRQ